MILAKVSLGPRKKICKLPEEFSSAREAIGRIFPELVGETKEGEGEAMTDDPPKGAVGAWHLEYDEGNWIEGDDDWEVAIDEGPKVGQFLNFQVVFDKGTGPKSYVPACLRCEHCECRGRKKTANLRDLPDWFIKSRQASRAQAANGSAKPAPSNSSQSSLGPAKAAGQFAGQPPSRPQGPSTAQPQGGPDGDLQQMTGYVPDPHIGQWTAYDRKRHVLMWMLNQFPTTPRSAKQIRILWPSKNKPKWKELHYLLNNEHAQGVLAMNPNLGPEPMFMLMSSVPQ